MHTGEKIKKYRVQNGMTQEVMASKLNTSPSRISQFELAVRSPRREKLAQIAGALEVPVEFLVERNIESKADAVSCLNEIVELFGDNIVLEYAHMLQMKSIDKVDDKNIVEQYFYRKQEN